MQTADSADGASDSYCFSPFGTSTRILPSAFLGKSNSTIRICLWEIQGGDAVNILWWTEPHIVTRAPTTVSATLPNTAYMVARLLTTALQQVIHFQGFSPFFGQSLCTNNLVFQKIPSPCHRERSACRLQDKFRVLQLQRPHGDVKVLQVYNILFRNIKYPSLQGVTIFTIKQRTRTWRSHGKMEWAVSLLNTKIIRFFRSHGHVRAVHVTVISNFPIPLCWICIHFNEAGTKRHSNWRDVIHEYWTEKRFGGWSVNMASGHLPMSAIFVTAPS